MKSWLFVLLCFCLCSISIAHGPGKYCVNVVNNSTFCSGLLPQQVCSFVNDSFDASSLTEYAYKQNVEDWNSSLVCPHSPGSVGPPAKDKFCMSMFGCTSDSDCLLICYATCLVCFDKSTCDDVSGGKLIWLKHTVFWQMYYSGITAPMNDNNCYSAISAGVLSYISQGAFITIFTVLMTSMCLSNTLFLWNKKSYFCTTMTMNSEFQHSIVVYVSIERASKWTCTASSMFSRQREIKNTIASP